MEINSMLSIAKLSTKIKNLTVSKKQVILISMILLITKVFGLIRQSYLLNLANSGSIQADIFINSTRVQDLVISFLLGGTIISTMIPIGARYISDQRDEFTSWFRQIFVSFNLIIICIVGLLIANVNHLVFWFVGNRLELNSIYVTNIAILLVGVFFFGLGVFYQSYLNLVQRFFWQNTIGLITNLCVITSIVQFKSEFGYYGSLAITLSFVINSILLAVSSHKNGLSMNIYNLSGYFADLTNTKHSYLVEFAKSSIPKLLLVSPFLISGLVLQRFGVTFDSTYYETSLNILNIYGIVLTSLGLVALPKFSTEMVNTDLQAFKTRVRGYLNNSIKFSLIVTALMMVIVDIVLILLTILTTGIEGIRFDSNYWLVSNTSKILCITILPQTLNEILNKYFLARDKSHYLVISNLTMIVMLTVIFFVLKYMGINSLYANATATVISYYITSGILLLYFKGDQI
jgi:peptidoglycan biosynthesis protein MviN/MurJ (putative lipid II flippase)